MKRRQFLTSAAVIGAGTLILPRTSLFGANAPGNKLNLALVGTWGRGEAHFGSISSENVVALCDINADHLAFGAKKFPGAKTYSDWRKLLDDYGITVALLKPSSQLCGELSRDPAWKTVLADGRSVLLVR